MSTAEKDAYIASLEQQNKELLRRVDILTEMILQMRRDRFGRSSEKTPKEDYSEQLYMPQVFNEVEITADPTEEEPAKVTSSGRVRVNPNTRRERILKDVPVREVLCEATDESLNCPQCAGHLKPMGTQTVRTELNYIPAQFEVVKYIQTSYECPKCKHTERPFIVKSFVPRSLMNHSLASPSSVANVMYQKYVNAMPLYRQEQAFKDMGIDLTRATLANWVIKCSDEYFSPIVKRLTAELVSRDIIHADETTVQVLKEDGKKPESKSYMWLYRTGNDGKSPIVLYDYRPSRSGENARSFLGDYQGYLQCDGYSGYNKLEHAVRCGCWAHVRRKFVEAIPVKKSDGIKSQAEIGRDYCNALFNMESQLKDLSPKERSDIRNGNEYLGTLAGFWSWLNTVRPLPGSKLNKAVEYAYKQKPYLENFLLDGRISISNNAAENAIRPFTVGRKNWLFADTVKGAKASAMVYSIIETAKANGLNTYKYLEYLLKEMPDSDWMRHPENLNPLMPWAEEAKAACGKYQRAN